MKFLATLFIFLILTACQTVAPPTPVEVENDVEEEPSNESSDYHDVIHSMILEGATLHEHSFFEWFFEEGSFVQIEQIVNSKTSSLYVEGAADAFDFVIAKQPTMNDPVRLNQEDIEWAGLLVNDRSTGELYPFFTVSSLDQNVVGFYVSNELFFVDVADHFGAGSGEGNLSRFVSRDGGNTWERLFCAYYTPEGYPDDINEAYSEYDGIFQCAK